MHKIIFIFFISFSSFVYASEPTLAILRSVKSNDIEIFNIGNYNFVCQPYGVVSLDNLYNVAKDTSACKKSITELYIKNPLLKELAYRNLYVEQRYHIEFRDNLCILYAKGELTYSEMLLKNGLAFIKPAFKDDEFLYSFTKAAQEAKSKSLGLYSSTIAKDCIKELGKN